ncbi:MAG: hypothetical protein LBV13_00830 [Methanomassiliicoccaceae archaeon]|nr:hypothetical protein [Methanomassiliicoccaceae archaeon]
MRNDKKGMAAIIDAFMFITVIGLIAAGMFAYSHLPDDKQATARTMHDTFFSIELRTEDMFPGTDTQCVRMCDLIAAHMASGEGDVRGYIDQALGRIIPPIYGYVFSFEYAGRILTTGDGGGRLTSDYSSEITIIDGNTMRTRLSLY